MTVKKKNQPKPRSSRARVVSENHAPGTAAVPVPLANTAWKQRAISFFILFHIVAIVGWSAPSQVIGVKQVRELVAPYMRWSGLFQAWDTFAPNPPRINSYVKALVITRQRQAFVFEFPKMQQLTFIQRYSKERYRKFEEVLPQQNNAALWPDAARHLAWRYDSAADHPDKVDLIRFVSKIKPETSDAFEEVAKPYLFYEEYVQPGDLK